MRLFSRIATMALLAIGFMGIDSIAQEQFHWKEKTSNGYTYQYVENDPSGARFYTLKNGLTVILSPSKKEPRIQTYIAVKAGSKTDPATHTGLAHYLEHMLFKGTDQFGTLDYSKEKPLLDHIEGLYEQYISTTDEAKRKEIYAQIDSVSGEAAKFGIANEYDKLMSAMGAKGTNAFTSFEQTVYTEDVPSNALDKYLAVQAERFRAPVFRIFHTELEAVYEEKNRSLDNDSRKMFESMFSTLFPNNNYGKQTTIGTIEHLKNPSLVEIRKYYDNYYVPNNMGIIMAGDFNPDEVIKKIDQNFAYMKNKEVPPYTFEPEKEISQPIKTEVFGPEPGRILLGYRFPGANTNDAQMLNLVGSILANGSAGLIDLNLVKQQKLLGAYAFPYILKDYSMLILQGLPTEGQSLEEVQKLLLEEIEKLKKGDFPEELITSISNNEKKSAIEVNESYSALASELMYNFTSETDWLKKVAYVENLTAITKGDIVKFANKYLNDNYVTVFKRQGEDNSIVKVEKPEITPVEMNRDKQSPFIQKIADMPENEISPVWLDFERDINRSKSGPFEVLSVQNEDNDLFRLYFYYETGSWSNRLLPLAAEYLSFLGTESKTAEEISQEFYKLASNFRISAQGENTYISLNGLQENFDATVALFDDLLKNAIANPEALDAYKARLMQSRMNAKENKSMIMRGLMNYAQYGERNPFNHELSNDELAAVTSEQLIDVLRDLSKYNHRILYYGPQTAQGIAKQLEKVHPAPDQFLPIPTKVEFAQIETKENNVLFAEYDMVQAEVYLLRNSGAYNENMIPSTHLFNEYFGGGMGSIVFQTIRESKALAYSTFAHFSIPSKKENRHAMMAYVGTQSDKFTDAIQAMNELLTELPRSEKAITTAKDGLRKKLATDRITQDGILFSYIAAEKMDRDFDIRKNIYDQCEAISYEDLQHFHAQEISGKPYTYCVVANENNVPTEKMKALGSFKKLTLEEIFGY